MVAVAEELQEQALLAPKEVQGAVANLSFKLPGLAESKVVFSDLVLDDAQLRRLDGREPRKEEEKEEEPLNLSGLSFLARLNALEAREGKKNGREARFSLSSDDHLRLSGEATASDGSKISLSFDYETVLAEITKTGEISPWNRYVLSILYDSLTTEHFILSLKPGEEQSHLHLLESVFADLHSVFSLADEKTQATIEANKERIIARSIRAYGGVTGEEYEQVKNDRDALQERAEEAEGRAGEIQREYDELLEDFAEARSDASKIYQELLALREEGEGKGEGKKLKTDLMLEILNRNLTKEAIQAGSAELRAKGLSGSDIQELLGLASFVETGDRAKAIQEGRREETKDGSQQVLEIIKSLLAGRIKIPEGKTLSQVLSAEIKDQLPGQVLHILDPIGTVICQMRDTIDRTGEAIQASNPALAPAAIQEALGNLIEESEERGRLEMRAVVEDTEGKLKLTLEQERRNADLIDKYRKALDARPTQEDLKRLETERDQLQVQLGQRAEVTPAQLVQLQRELATLKASGRPEDRAKIVKMEAELAETQRKLKEGVGTSEQVGKIAAILGVKPGEVLAAVEEIVGEKLKKEKELRRLLGEITSYKSGLKTDTLYRMFLPFLTPGNGISTKDLEGNFPPDKPELIKKVKSRTLRISDNDLKRGELESGLREEINYFLNAIKTCFNARFEGDVEARAVIPQLLLPSGVSQEGKLPYLKTLLDLGLYLLE